MNKRGLSEVISVTFGILIVVIIATIIATYSGNFLEKQKKSSEPFLNSNLKATIEDIKIENTGLISSVSGLRPRPLKTLSEEEKITIIISRTDNEDIIPKGVRFTFYDKSGSSYTYDINDPPAETGISKTYELTNTELNINSFSNIEKVSLSFILEQGSQTGILSEKEITQDNNV